MKKFFLFVFVTGLCLTNLIGSNERSDYFTALHSHPHWYNLHVSEKFNFVWIRVFKVASGTIRDVLRDKVDDIEQSRPPSFSKKYANYFTFAFVRNSWSRIVSCYHHKILTRKSKEFKECFGKDFDFFVDYISQIDVAQANPHIKLQTRLIPLKECDFIGKLDHFEEDLRYVCDSIGIEMKKPGNKHQTNHLHYSHYYTPRTQKIIAKLYKEEIEAFGFTFEDRKAAASEVQ